MANIVIVDDSPANAIPLARLLRYAGHEVTCILRSGIAIESLRRIMPDLLLLDVGMPEVDGIELLRLLRQDAALRGLRVVMYSALYDSKLVEEAKQLGAADYLEKGPNWGLLLDRIQSHLPKP